MGQTPTRLVARFARELFCLGSLTLLAACGGGGGGGSSNGPQSTPSPLPSPVTPITPAGPSRSTAEIILRDGDLVASDLEIANIEDAALATGGALAVVVRTADPGNPSAILRRAGDGSYSVAFDPRTSTSDIDASTLARLRIAPTGEIVFQSGTGLDDDRLYRIVDGAPQALAGAAPGPVFPEFRMLGNVRIGRGGVVAFAGGGQECEVVVGSQEPRVTCTNALYVADASGVVKIDAPDLGLDLARQRPSAVRVEIDPLGGAWFSLPRRNVAPTLVHYAGGEATVVLKGDSVLPGVGELSSVEAVAANAAGEVLIEGTLQAVEGERRPRALGVLRGETFAVLAREGETLDGANVATLRGLALDGAGSALFEARLGSADAPDDQFNSLWLGNASRLTRIVREDAPFPGEEQIVLGLLGSRLNAAGDVAFVTELGTKNDGVGQREEVRATVRRADGRLVTIASTRHTAQYGTLSELQIAGFDEEGTLLMVGSRSRTSDRLLLLGRSDVGAD